MTLAYWMGRTLRWWRRLTGQCPQKRRFRQIAERRPLERLLDKERP